MLLNILKSTFSDGDPTSPFGEPPDEEVSDGGELTHNFEHWSSEAGTDGSFTSPPDEEGNKILRSEN